MRAAAASAAAAGCRVRFVVVVVHATNMQNSTGFLIVKYVVFWRSWSCPTRSVARLL